MQSCNVLIYQDGSGKAKVSARFSDDNVWLTQTQLAEIFETSRANIAGILGISTQLENLSRWQLVGISDKFKKKVTDKLNAILPTIIWI